VRRPDAVESQVSIVHDDDSMGAMATNWAGNYTYRATRVHEPATFDELRELVTRAPRIRVLGSRHSFTDIGDSDQLVSLKRLPADIELHEDRVSCSGGLTYGALAPQLKDKALHNLASLPHISVAGAVATGTHGSGDGNGNLATAVTALRLLTSDGELREYAQGDEDFEGVVVNLGALGVVTRVRLAVEPTYEVRQRVFEGLSWDALYAHLDEIMAAAYSVSVFTRWGEDVDMVWLKSREGERQSLFDARPARQERHPIMELDPVHCTKQLGVAGPWWDRLPHFRMGFTPSNGDEIQSEYFVPREHAVDAIHALQKLDIAPRLQVCEFRTIAADDLWLSPHYRRDTLAFHFTWNVMELRDLLAEIEDALRPFGYRAHLGKLFVHAGDYDLRAFTDLAERLDPRGAFENAWFERLRAAPARPRA
jgi:alditol oxidase